MLISLVLLHSRKDILSFLVFNLTHCHFKRVTLWHSHCLLTPNLDQFSSQTCIQDEPTHQRHVTYGIKTRHAERYKYNNRSSVEKVRKSTVVSQTWEWLVTEHIFPVDQLTCTRQKC